MCVGRLQEALAEISGMLGVISVKFYGIELIGWIVVRYCDEDMIFQHALSCSKRTHR